MFETLFRTNEASQSTTLGVVVTMLASVFLSFMLVATYRFTSREVVERKEFMQGLALISLVAAMIMQAIGDSLARGLGMLGALSIIRFRTSLTSPRNMAFMFASLAAGIACGVFGFTIAFIGTAAFCLVAFVLAFRRGDDAKQLIGDLRVNVEPDSDSSEEVERILRKYCTRFRLYEFRFTKPKPLPLDAPPGTKTLPASQELNYEFKLKSSARAQQVLTEVEAIADVLDQRLRFARGQEIL